MIRAVLLTSFLQDGRQGQGRAYTYHPEDFDQFIYTVLSKKPTRLTRKQPLKRRTWMCASPFYSKNVWDVVQPIPARFHRWKPLTHIKWTNVGNHQQINKWTKNGKSIRSHPIVDHHKKNCIPKENANIKSTISLRTSTWINPTGRLLTVRSHLFSSFFQLEQYLDFFVKCMH
jgi:hypothetical protein